jgi:predicted ATP-binding protein involved in virulence
VRHLTDVDIVLSDTERKHLILTGKNGSGKTSLLEAIRYVVGRMQSFLKVNTHSNEIQAQKHLKMEDTNYNNVIISYSSSTVNFRDTFFTYIPAVRSQLVMPKAIEPVDITDKTEINRNNSINFLKYILSLDYQLYGAKNDKNKALEAALSTWFDSFTEALREIYDCNDLKLQRDTKNLAFMIEMTGREPFGLHEMADGYKAFLEIYMELIMRFENSNAVIEYSQPAIVLIDEIETHLHIELQKRALPFLTRMFPNVQFIVTTHSPFVITSLSNAVVYDLEKNEQLDNPSYYSYEAIVESFLDANMYSTVMRQRLDRYRELCFMDRNAEENEEFLRTKTELELMAPASKELFVEFRQLEQERKDAKKNDKAN